MAEQKEQKAMEGQEEMEEMEAMEGQQADNLEEEETEGELEEGNKPEGEPQTEEEDSQEGETCEEPSEEGQEEGKKGFFKKKDKKNKQEEKIAELTDQLQLQMAEFDNFRKRTEKEKAQMFEIGAKSVIEVILPVVDNFERGLSAVPEDAKEDPIAQGMDKIYKQLMAELEKLGVTPMEAVGKEFDPEFHNAVMQVENEEYESGIVAQELQKGYMYRESVVRHSMVAVVQ